jgi:hypothetical protein
MTEQTVQTPITVSDAVKPGWKTTEFWLSLATSLAGLAALFGVITPTEAGTAMIGITQAVGGIMSTIAIVGYSWSRGKAKQKDIAAILEMLSKIPQVKQ